MYAVYALIDPRDYSTRYIGITDNIYRRFREHMKGRTNNPAKNDWVRELREQNMLVFMKTLEVTETLSLARKRESYWITHYRALGVALFNHVALPKAKKAKAKAGRKSRELQHAINWAVWEWRGFDKKYCPWKNPYECMKHRPPEQDLVDVRRILGLTQRV